MRVLSRKVGLALTGELGNRWLSHILSDLTAMLQYRAPAMDMSSKANQVRLPSTVRAIISAVVAVTAVCAPPAATDSITLPDWLRRPICAGYQNWAPSAENAKRMADSGLTTLVWAWNHWRDPVSDDPGDFRVTYDAKALAPFLAWLPLCQRYRPNLVAELDCWADDEPRIFSAKRSFRHVILATGKDGGVACPREPRYWQRVVEDILFLARLGPPVKGVVLDTETYSAGSIYPGYGALEFHCCYCDDCWRSYCASRRRQSASPSLPTAERYNWLADHFRLADYAAWLEAAMADVGRSVRQRVHARHPNLVLGILNLFGPGDWYGLGLLRGLSSPRPSRPGVLGERIRFRLQ